MVKCARVQLWFNEWREPHFCHVLVWNHDGTRADLGDVEVGPDDPAKLSVVESRFPFTIRGSR